MKTTALLIQYLNGFTEQIDAVAIAADRRNEDFLSLGAIPSADRAQAIASRELANRAREVEEISGRMVSTGLTDEPYVAFMPGDTITVPTLGGGTSLQRVRAITMAEEGNKVVWEPEFADDQLERDQKFAVWLKTMDNGSLEGTSASASPPPATPVVDSRDVQGQNTIFERASEVVEEASYDHNIARSGTLIELIAVLQEVRGSSTSVTLRINGFDQQLVVVAAGDLSNSVQFAEPVSKGDKISIYAPQVGFVLHATVKMI